MTLPVVNLDDRRFEDLVAEARERLQHALPELAGISEGDPLYALVDVFAGMTETLIGRTNRIPERQQQILLNLLGIPRRQALPATGLVCIDYKDHDLAEQEYPVIPVQTALYAGRQPFLTEGEVQATPLMLDVMIKRPLSDDERIALGLSSAEIAAAYKQDPEKTIQPFVPHQLNPEQDLLDTSASIDGAFYLALSVEPKLAGVDKLKRLAQQLAGSLINIGLVPAQEIQADMAHRVSARQLSWQLAIGNENGVNGYLPLEVMADSSQGGRVKGVTRLRLPPHAHLLQAFLPPDPADAGIGQTPPWVPANIKPEQLFIWLKLTAPNEPALKLSHVSINAVEVSGQGILQNLVLGVGNGQAGQKFALPADDIEPESLQVEVETYSQYEMWQAVEHFANSNETDAVYTINSVERQITFGDGLLGKRPPAGKRVRIAFARYGGGVASNLPASSIQQFTGSANHIRLRQPVATTGGRDRESIDVARKRIPAYLAHRNRAVTADDFRQLTLYNPLVPVGRADVRPGFFPGKKLADARHNVPGVVSIFVLPGSAGQRHKITKPTAGFLRDIHQYLSRKMVLGTELFVLSPKFVPVAISMQIQILDEQRSYEIQQRIMQVIQTYLWPLSPGGIHGEGWQYGHKVDNAETQTVISRVDDVRAVTKLTLWKQEDPSDKWIPVEGLELEEYELPELVLLTIGIGDNLPDSPNIVANNHSVSGSSSGQTENESGSVAIPVVTDFCRS